MPDQRSPNRGPIAKVFIGVVYVLVGYAFLMLVAQGVQLVAASRIWLGMALIILGGVSLVVMFRVAVSRLRGEGFFAKGELSQPEEDYFIWLFAASVILGVLTLVFVVTGAWD
jgi:hypothetical protein